MNWKPIIKISLGICCFNTIYLFGLVYFWFQSIETEIGCACDYWRCVDMGIVLFPLYLGLLAIFNLIFLISYIVFNIIEG